MIVTINDLKKYKLVYLAAPYTKHPDGLEYAYKVAAAQLAAMDNYGVRAYSPIAHWHMASVLDPYNHLKWSTPAEWLERNLPMLDICDCLVIHYCRDEIESEGIDNEIGVYEMQGKPIVEDFCGASLKGRLRFTAAVGYG